MIFVADAHRAATENVSLCTRMKLTAFLELESAIRGCGFLA
jgi:hypothetical protein